MTGRWLATLFLIGTLGGGLPVRAHEEITPVIVDTDVALDDARALTLLATSPQIALKAVVTSDGSVSPTVGGRNVRRILQFLNDDSVPVGVGRALTAPPPPWRERAESLGWANLPPAPTNPLPSAVTLIENTLAQSKGPVTYVCLGPLTNLAEALHDAPAIRSRLAMVWFSGAPPGDAFAGWNVARDPAAAKAVFASGVPIVAAALPDARLLKLDDNFLAQLADGNAPAARLMERLHREARVREHLHDPHVRAWDDTVALLLLAPSIGRLTEPTGNVRRVADFDRDRAASFYRQMVQGNPGHADERPLVTLRAIPSDPNQFQDDVAPFVGEIITRHGEEEWKIVVLTNELHRHLGLYSILGAKMGLRARELLGVDVDQLHVESLAGQNPPISCFNDGLQVSTGASLGRGTITVPDTKTPLAAAVFTAGGRRLRMQVKDSVIRKIEAEISAAIRQYGNLTPAYFAAVRRISQQAWRDLDRRTIFEETLTVQPKR
ncbi:MAG TPA: nucleoside hydrolase [Verrucomicrobiae bacterium]|nr:nucleoside hydrolase [Verrucomicrobiae bacterium]